MEITFKCSSCKAKLAVDVKYAGLLMYCPRCEDKITIPLAGIGNWSTLGDFRIIRAIGEGSTGKVYLARQNSMNREVALKVLNPQFSTNTDKLKEFYKEVKIIARLTHPHIVTALKAGSDGQYHYLAMSYISGGTLEDLVNKNGQLHEKTALKYMLLCAQALEYAWHKERILHLDLKPENIMLDKNGLIKVTDLGIARCLNEVDDSQQIKGTPAFMSPEQTKSSVGLDQRSDIFSLGGTLYFLLTGKKPFGEGSVEEILNRVKTKEVIAPTCHNHKLSQNITDLIRAMMHKDLTQRIPSWPECTIQIKKCINNESAS
jgi:eukaryotic-like serine/threonine-protein kinase